MPSRGLFAQPVMKAFSPNSRHNGNNKSLTHTYMWAEVTCMCVCVPRRERFSIQRFGLQHTPRKRLISCGASCQPHHPSTHPLGSTKWNINCVSSQSLCHLRCGGSPVVRCLIKVGLRRGLSSIFIIPTFDDKLFPLSQFWYLICSSPFIILFYIFAIICNCGGKCQRL